MLRALTVGVSALALCAAGCGGEGRVKEADIEIKVAMSPLDQAISFLNRYAQGNPLGSEASMFEDVVKRVRETDAAKADILEKGFADIQKASPAQRRSIAAALIKRVSPNTAPPPPK